MVLELSVRKPKDLDKPKLRSLDNMVSILNEIQKVTFLEAFSLLQISIF